ncbi:hypothetical protein [Dyadobacter bucti]|uniref:hypothetical protein n=1 Tax=Dyadobacter bucti TaxID=2572203 RepID=UPI003F700DAF
MKSVVLVLFFASSIFAVAQDPIRSEPICRKCKKQQDLIHQTHFLPYLQTDFQRSFATNNWTEVCFNNLDSVLPPLAKNANIFSVRYDALGCVYPKFMTSDMLGLGPQSIGLRDWNMYKYSFYKLFYPKSESDRVRMRQDIETNLPSPGKEFLTSLLAERRNHNGGSDNATTPDSIRVDDIFRFVNSWNDKYQSEAIEEIRKVVDEKKIKKIVFFFPGFNVPYALAQIQANNIIDAYKHELNYDQLFEDILFVKLFWPSFAYKESRFTEHSSKFNNDINIKSMIYFTNARNRVYSIGFQIRKLIYSLKFSGTIDIIGHSSGSDLISVTLIDPIKKINLKRYDTAFNRALVRNYKNTPLPSNRIKTFLNAPSIPGIITFGENQMDRPEQRNYHWLVGFNNSDKVLQKMKGRRQLENPSNWFGNTNLGGNVNDEVWKTISSIKSSNPDILNNFRFVELGKQKDTFGHDFFCYMNQIGFKAEFGRFIAD